MSSWIDGKALFQIVVFGLLAGAGLPALVAVGVRALNPPPRSSVPLPSPSRPGPSPAAASLGRLGRLGRLGPLGRLGRGRLGRGRVALAVACFAIVLAAIGYAIYLLVSAGH